MILICYLPTNISIHCTMSLWNSNANKNWTRIQEHFFFGAFHPTRDYSVEVGQLVLVVADAC